jgi:hypothetical protein
MTSFNAVPAASQNAAGQSRQAEINKAVEEAQRAVQEAMQEAEAAQQQARQAAQEARQARDQARDEAGQTAAGNGVIVFPSGNGGPDIRISVDGGGIHVSQDGRPQTTIPIHDVVPRGAVQITYAVSAALIAVAIVGPLLRFFLRRAERRQVTNQLSAGAQARLDAMERNIDTVAVELERVSEGQRFTNRLLEQQRPLEYAQRPDR